MLKEIYKNYKDEDIITIKISELAPMSDFENEDEIKDYKEFVENDYDLEVLEQGDNNPNDGFIIVKGEKYDIENYIREVFGFSFEDTNIELI